MSTEAGILGGPAFVAGGTIAPFTIVKLNTTVRQVINSAATTDTAIIGVSQPGQKGAPGVAGSSTTTAAVSGDSIQVIVGGNVCKVTLGSGGCTVADNLTTDASGNAVTASAGNYCVGWALETGNSGDLVDCYVWPHKM